MEFVKYKCYIIKNSINNKVYIGITKKNLDERLKEHIKVSRLKNKKKRKSIHNAIRKYGKEFFKIELLCWSRDRCVIFKKEMHYIKKYNSYINGYNQTAGGDAGPVKSRYSKEFIERVLRFYIKCNSVPETARYFNLKNHVVFDFTRFKFGKNKNIDSNIMNDVLKIKSASKKKKKITKSVVIKILSDFAYNECSISDIADKYLISASNAWSIVRRDTFKDVKVDEELSHALDLKFSERRFWKR